MQDGEGGARPGSATFEIGLAMAGAVSAGAYSGGVFDFLIQALDAWENERKAGRTDIPNHRALIKVISGASAGAITGGIGAIALAAGPRPTFTQTAGRQILHCVLPSLYQAWVVRPCFVSTRGGSDLLSLEDLAPQPPSGRAGAPAPGVRSLLNSTVLEQIRDEAIALPGRGAKHAFLPETLHLYFTVSNLRGIPYAIAFEGSARGYGMQAHADRLHYRLEGLGSATSVSPWADADASTRIDASGLFGPDGPSRDWRVFGTGALASGAFPVGLAPRGIDALPADYDQRYLPVNQAKLQRFPPSFPWSAPGAPVPPLFTFLSVDGGLINNEPFEYARFALMTNPPHPNEREGDRVDRAVVMIDPFPEPPGFLGEGKPADTLVGVLKALFPALVNQARFKLSELQDAADRSVFSRYLVAPHRQFPGRPVEERYAIACGVLQGFGGFLDEAFRAHDYQLGRRNCQRFLQKTFALPPGNPIVAGWLAAVRNDPAFRGESATDGTPMHQIVPLLGSAAEEVPLPPWPRIEQAALDTLQRRIGGRLDAVVPLLIEDQTASRILRLALKVAARVGRGRILDYARWAILSDLVRRDLVEGWTLPAELDGNEPDAVRAVLAELAKPAYTFRTVAGIARDTLLPDTTIRSILGVLIARPPGRHRVVGPLRQPSDAEVYGLHERMPSGLFQLPILRSVRTFIDAPVID